MNRSRIVVVAAVALIGAGAAAQAGPCTTQIAQLQRQIGRLEASPESGPSAPQSVGAQLHHQPTPGAVQSAESKANADVIAALERARQADREGNARACGKALEEARRLYGIN
jgi:hypothetical protein